MARNTALHTPPVHSQKQKLSMNDDVQTHTISSAKTGDDSFRTPCDVVRQDTHWSTRVKNPGHSRSTRRPFIHKSKSSR